MFQGIRELTAAKGRTALIMVTVTLITVLVTLLSSLASGLSFQSVSALQERLSPQQSLVLENNGSTSLTSSRLSPEQIREVEAAGGETMFVARARMGSQPIIVMSDATLEPNSAVVPSQLQGDLTDTLPGAQVSRTDREVFLDHIPVVTASPSIVAAVPGAASAGIVDETVTADALPHNVQVLQGDQRWNASASYSGEQMSLNLMINLLYVISALVLGAFFTVWTLQRLRGVAISAALGASRRVLVADSVGQAFLVLAVGIIAGAVITLGVGQIVPSAMPMILSSSTLVWPSLILAAAGLLGAAISLKPVLCVEPRNALANA